MTQTNNSQPWALTLANVLSGPEPLDMVADAQDIPNVRLEAKRGIWYGHLGDHADQSTVTPLTMTYVSIGATIKVSGVPYSWRGAGVGWVGNPPTTSLVTRVSGSMSGSATTLGTTIGVAINVPIKFDSVRIGFVHRGGYGVCTGLKACIASTDDVGALDYALGTSNIDLKKFITPKLSGSEYNTLSENGWKSVTFSSVSSTDIPDAGAGLDSIVWSDLIRCASKVDARGTGWRSLLVRVYPGAGPTSYSNAMAGITTGTTMRDDLGAAVIAVANRPGDNVSNPATWEDEYTPSFATSPFPCMVIEFHGSTTAKSVMFCGDSRFDTNTEGIGAAYHNFVTEFEKQANASGNVCKVLKVCQGGATTAQYMQWGYATLSNSTPDLSVFIGYSVNQGAPTEAVMSLCRYEALRHIEKCRAIGCSTVIVTTYPGYYNSTQLALVRSFEDWCRTVCKYVFSPLSRYGDVNGYWLPGVSADGTNHMTQAAYAVMASDLIEFMSGAGLL